LSPKRLLPFVRVFASALLLAVCAAHAQAPASPPWPTKPITLVVPYAAGGSTDITARLVGNKLSAELGQPVIVENRQGAGGSISAAYVARAAPDGYTLLTTVSSHTINAKLFKNLPYDLKKDFTPVGQVLEQPYILVVNKDLPAHNLAELVARIRADKGALNYGSGGVGSSNHLAGALLNYMAGGHMVHVAYGGGPASIQAVISGDIQILMGVAIDLMPHIRSGAVRAIAVTTKNRSPLLPDLPTVAEALPGYEVDAWVGFLAPAGVPAPVITRLNTALNKVLQDPGVQSAIASQGGEVAGGTPEAFGQLVARELDTAEKMVKVSGAVPQ